MTQLRQIKISMSKVHLLNIIFLIVEIIAFIPLTIEVFGDMNPDAAEDYGAAP
jgi:hypothetical protein